MKKTNIVQLGIAVAIISIGYSCNKETITPDTSRVASTAPQSEILERSQIIEKNLLSFKTNLKAYESNKNGESTITYEADSAVWYLEATINYTYSNPSEATKEHSVDSFEVVLNKTVNGKVGLSEMQRVYNKSVNSLGAIYAAANYSDKVFKLSDLKVISENAQEIRIQVKGDVGDRGDKNGITSGWTWGQKQGYYHNGQILLAGAADATDAIERHANSILSPYPSTGGTSISGLRKVILNPVVWSGFIYPSYVASGLLWSGNAVGLYQSNGTRKITLLSSTEIITYSNGAATIANLPQYRGTNPPPVLVDVEDDVIPSTGGLYPYSDRPVTHNIIEITYGNVIWVQDNPSTF